MADSDEPARKPSEPSKNAQAAAPESAKPGRLSFTIDAATGAMLSVEAVEETGARRALTAKEKTALAKQITRHTLRDILETTFEAGIASVLGDDDEDDDEDDEVETADDVALRHLVVGPLMARSAARRFMQREILGQAILAALIEQAPAAAPAKAPHTPSRRSAATSSHPPTHRVTRH